jgi:hypothetical protein
MLTGIGVLGVALAIFVFLWIVILWGSQYFGSAPDH